MLCVLSKVPQGWVQIKLSRKDFSFRFAPLEMTAVCEKRGRDENGGFAAILISSPLSMEQDVMSNEVRHLQIKKKRLCDFTPIYSNLHIAVDTKLDAVALKVFCRFLQQNQKFHLFLQQNHLIIKTKIKFEKS